MLVQGREVVTGPDISNHQYDVDHAAVAAAGHSFLWAKASEGTGYVDPYYIKNRDGAAAAGLVFGAYHWITPDSDGRAQADLFLRVTSNAQGCSFVVLDAEQSGLTADNITAWLQSVEAQVSCPIAIYCGAYTDPTVRPVAWRKYAPWLAAYGPNRPGQDPSRMADPVNPTPWGSWTGWQFTSVASVPGVNGNCDMSVLDRAWFDALIGASTSSAAPSQTSHMETDMILFTNPDGRDELIGLSPDGSLCSSWSNSPGGEFGNFTVILPADAPKFSGITKTKTTPPDGRLAVLLAGPMGVPYGAWQTIPSSGPWAYFKLAALHALAKG